MAGERPAVDIPDIADIAGPRRTASGHEAPKEF